MSGADIHHQIETLWKNEAARIIAGLMRMVRNLDVAEDLAQEALVVALEKWPGSGIPPNPGAWLNGDGQTAGHRSLPIRGTQRSEASGVGA